LFPASVSRLTHTLSVPLHESQDTPQIPLYIWIKALNPFYMFRKSWTAIILLRIKKAEVMLQLSSPSSHPL
jgi:hypothetical protein